MYGMPFRTLHDLNHTFSKFRNYNSFLNRPKHTVIQTDGLGYFILVKAKL
ncbi:hypothetical protein SAMN04487896_0511 [Paenibacillus sp. ov031]|nr:hypothetical protein gpAD87_14420 [Paenibacillus sp. AD87]SEA32817.1 hypothetical protein SAMN03159332_1156 [Paenibacillus sp. 276b]SHN54243.1 hypothetical protein SAMN04487896_0511 [Paenibacillus sp. ov031]SLJ96623.1 hypothetical protein SAMN06272722_102421 [Paenibacillus sp. RU5A]SOC67094.1 hypothetical protein SAMN05880581_102577 [Paenibacillus sp. RU26A]SOC69753.1 hypothetical protein SAMN05880586_102421 [Paenibacillus sp. RU5M]